MADITSFTHKWRAVPDANANGVGKVHKRNRQPLSCLPCRTRKLKCDRGHPCEGCAKRDESSSCTYGKIQSSISARPNGSRNVAHDRLQHLERLVMQMIETNPSNTDSQSMNDSIEDSSEKDELVANDGHLRLKDGDPRYTGSTHWTAILENIQELKSAMAHGDSPITNDMDDLDGGPDTLFGPWKPQSLEAILQDALPPKVQADRRLSTYFNAKYFVIPIVHTYQFQRQYEQFWKAPLNAAPLWVSILFAIMAISAGLTTAAGLEPPVPEGQQPPSKVLMAAAAHCLILGGYTKPRQHVIQALGLFAQAKYASTMDPSRESGMIFAIIVRLGYRMGYHRDPDNFPNFSAFEGEMRRRTWAMMVQFDRMITFQQGHPNCIPAESWDTRPPLNLADSDFDEDTKVLPPPRPETEATQILYFGVKFRIMAVFGKIATNALSFRSISRDEITALDKELRDMYSIVPPVLRSRPMSQSFSDPGYVIMLRVNLEFLFQKGRVVLHRKPMTQGDEESRKACIDASLQIIRLMADLQTEYQPGGQLYSEKWMMSSFTMNDFLLASMALCLALSMGRRRAPDPAKYFEDDAEAREQLVQLRQAHLICVQHAASSKEMKHVGEALGTALARLQPPSSASLPQANGSLMHNTFSSTSTSTNSSVSHHNSTQASTSYTPPNPQSNTLNLTPLSLNDVHLSSSIRFPAPAKFSRYSPEPGQILHPPQPHAHLHAQPHLQAPSFLPSDSLSPFTGMSTQDNELGPLENILGSTDDLDWTVLDQYLVNPDGFDMGYQQSISQSQAQSVALPFGMIDDGEGSDGGQDEGQEMEMGKRDGEGDGEDWTSTPFRFLGGEAREVKVGPWGNFT